LLAGLTMLAVAAVRNTKFKLAGAATHTRLARVFVDRCIEQLLRGELDTATAAMSKWWVTDMQQKVIDECQGDGGWGLGDSRTRAIMVRCKTHGS
jgi:long-chain-acyl-CoA dehydrogenase